MDHVDGFTPAEYADRTARVRHGLREQGVDVAVVLAPDSQFWLCGLESFISGVLTQALIIPAADDSETVLLMWDADLPIAHDTARSDRILSYRFGVDDPVALIGAEVRAAVGTSAVVGLDAGSRAVPHSLGLRLRDALAPASVVDCSGLLGQARQVKSAAELDCLRRAGAFASLGLDAAAEHARPGITERQLAAEIEYAMRRAGSDYPSIPTELSSGRRSAQVHATPSHRVLEAGDLVHVEIGGVERRYNAVGLQTLHVGGAAAPVRGRHLYDVARACLEAGLDAARPGTPAADVEAPALELLRKHGVGDGFAMRFGYGVGAGYPPTWLDPFAITRTSADVLLPGTAFVLHACLLDEQAEVGVLVGGTYAMTEHGLEMLSGAGPVDLVTT